MSNLFKKKKSSRSRREKNTINHDSPKVRRDDHDNKGGLEQSQSDSGEYSGTIITETQEEEEIEGLVFTGERVNGKPVIKGGNIEKLVEKLTDHKYNDVKYAQAFMLTFRSFTTPSELLDLLIGRYNIKPPTNASEEEIAGFDGVRKVVRLRVFNILKGWLNNGYYDFTDDTLKNVLLDFINNQMASSLKNPSQTLLNIIEKKENAAEKEYEHIFTTPPPKPLVLTKNKDTSGSIILSYHSTELARQLTLIEYQLYSAIKPSECVGQNWMSKRKEELAPNILAMIHRFNFVSTWLSSEIVRCPDLQKRTQILKHILDIAEACKQLNNFNALMEIISGLNSSSIFRLKQTWAGLPRKYVAMFEEMRNIMSRDKSYKNFRVYLHKVNPPCIPYLGMYLTDLTFIEEGNKDNLPNGYINMAKRQQLAQVISEIQTYQNTPYCLQEVPEIRDLLFNAEALPEQQCYQLSLKREGRDGTVDDQTPDLPYGEMEKKSAYVFDKPDTEDCIIYEEKDGIDTPKTSQVTAASLVKLVERLTYHEYSDLVFTSSFLMSYKQFTTASELLDLLENRFQMPRPANPSKQQMAKFQSTLMIPIHLRIVNFLRSWLNSHPIDFISDTQFQQKLQDHLTLWSESNPLLKQAVDSIRKVIEKKLMLPLPTPECRYIGFLRDESDEKESNNVSLLSFDDDLIAKQFTLIEQTFFTSIGCRECLCSSWDPETMETEAPNFLAMRTNFDIVRRWTITEVLKQPDIESRYRNISILICVAEKLIELHNFSTSMSILTGIRFLKEKMESIFNWIPNSVMDKYEDIIRYLEQPKRLKDIENSFPEEPVIPHIEPYMRQIDAIRSLPANTPNGLINFDRIRKIYTVVQQLDIFRSHPFSFEYSNECGGYLYHGEVWEQDTINNTINNVSPVDPPEIRPEFEDIRNPEEEFQDISDDESDSLNTPRERMEEAALCNLRGHLIDIISEESDIFDEFMKEAKSNVANDLLDDLRNFSGCIQDELSLIQSQFGVEQSDSKKEQDISNSYQRILQRIFPGCSFALWTELDSEGVVYGWEDQVNVIKVTRSEEEFLVNITPQVKKSDASNAIRLFKFFNESADKIYKNVIISSSCSLESTSVLQENNISLFNFSGQPLM